MSTLCYCNNKSENSEKRTEMTRTFRGTGKKPSSLGDGDLD